LDSGEFSFSSGYDSGDIHVVRQLCFPLLGVCIPPWLHNKFINIISDDKKKRTAQKP
ncbi:unnamed protein product, partial [Arabidopsis halleri]